MGTVCLIITLPGLGIEVKGQFGIYMEPNTQLLL